MPRPIITGYNSISCGSHLNLIMLSDVSNFLKTDVVLLLVNIFVSWPWIGIHTTEESRRNIKKKTIK